MDIQRYLLIGAMALLSWMLLTEWVVFKDNQNQISAASFSVPETNEQQPQSAVLASDSDVPDLVDMDSAPTIGSDAIISKGLSSVTVSTDTLDVTIDLNGGDIVYSGLKRHLAKLDDPDKPFVLLEQNPRREYIAQSGLIGPDGIDSTTRARFESETSSFDMGDNPVLSVPLYHTAESGLRVVKEFLFTRGSHLVMSVTPSKTRVPIQQKRFICLDNSNATAHRTPQRKALEWAWRPFWVPLLRCQTTGLRNFHSLICATTHSKHKSAAAGLP